MTSSYYGSLADLITSPEEAQAAGKLLHRMKTLTHASLLVVDEMGYLPLSRTGAMHFFQLASLRLRLNLRVRGPCPGTRCTPARRYLELHGRRDRRPALEHVWVPE